MSARPSSLDRFRGCILGAAIGDALGSPYEFSRNGIEVATDGYGLGVFNTEPGCATDDSTLMRFHAESIVESEGNPKWQYDRNKTKLIAWYRNNPKDMGGQTRAAIESHIANNTRIANGLPIETLKDTGSCGNGSLMAVAPAGLVATNPIDAGKRGYDYSTITHPNELCKYICGVYTTAIYELSRTDERTSLAPRGIEVPRWMQIDGQSMGYVAIAAGLAFEALERAKELLSTPAAVRSPVGFDILSWVISRGGDADTNASITGALLGAAFGMEIWYYPVWILDELDSLEKWSKLADDLYEVAFS